MDEISMFTMLRPSAPADPLAAREATRQQLDDVFRAPAETAAVRPQARRRHRMLAAGGVIMAAAAAAIVVPAVLPSSATGTFVTKAWAVERQQDGTVTVSYNAVANDPAGLQRALRADGIHAFVLVTPMKSAYVKGMGKVFYAACNYPSLDREPPSVKQAVVGVAPNGGWTISPSAMPKRSSLLIALWPSPVFTIQLSPIVLSTYQAPTCVPGKPPAPPQQ